VPERQQILTVLELGSGGGNNAYWMKARFDLTLVDLAPGMVEVSRRLNPECIHVSGDMRTLRLGRTFDAVFVHDAVMYMVTVADLEAAVATARAHLTTGGVALFAPDFVRERFTPETTAGGRDGVDGRAVRYLDWSYDPDPSETWFITDYVYALRDGTGTVEVVHDSHVEGLFSRQEWATVLRGAGFGRVEVVVESDEVDWAPRLIFVAHS